MPTTKTPRKGSLQFWPRKRVNKFLPSINWNAIKSDSKGLKGFIGYKAGMASAYVKDNTPDSMTKGKRVIIPVTIFECPPLKIFSVRFYKNGVVAKDILLNDLSKELKKKIKLPKKKIQEIENIKIDDFDDLRVLVHSVVKKTNLKKTPDVIEMGLSGSIEEKFNFIRENLSKEISVTDVFKNDELIDVRGLTKGKGFQGPVKRFGVRLRQHKSEKGIRKVGSIAPWHPARVTFRTPMAGQLGMFTRASYNGKIIELGHSENKKDLKGIKNFGDIKTDYLILRGSSQGPSKRQVVFTLALRPTKKQGKKSYEMIELR